jgi:hypothetical protein
MKLSPEKGGGGGQNMRFAPALVGSLLTLSLSAAGGASAEAARSTPHFIHAKGKTLEMRARARAIRAYELVEMKRPPAFRPRKHSILRYERPMQFGQSDLVLRLRAPGKGRAIASLELRF